MRYLFSLLLVLSSIAGYTQTITRKVMPTLGGFHADSAVQASYTVGETFTATLSNASVIATQGFQQADSIEAVQASVTANGATTFCNGNTVTLQANTGNNLLYQWMLNGMPVSGATSYQYNAGQSGSYTVRVSNMNNFYAVSNAVNVVVYSLPVVGALTTPSALVCGGSSVTLSGTGAQTYTWTGGVNNAVPFAAFNTTTYTVTGTDVHGCTATSSLTLTVKPQPTVVPIANQNYCNGQAVSAIPLSGTPAGVLFDITGGSSKGLPNQTGVSAIPAFTTTATGNAIVTLTPKANGCVGIPSTYTMSVTNCPPVTVNLKFYIQGYYTDNGMMQPVLYNEGASTDPNSLITDYVIVELHATTPPYAMLKTTIATLKTNGTLSCSFPGSVTNTSFYIVIHHRNTVATWSAAPVLITPNMVYDFSNAVTKAYGSNEIDVSGDGSVWAFYNGDINQDDNIDLLDIASFESDVNDFIFGYVETDVNGDGNTDLLDTPVLELNTNDFIFSNHP